MAFSKDNLKGIVLALISCGFIGASFIIKKKGQKKAAAASGVRADCVGGYSYLVEPLWWFGMITRLGWTKCSKYYLRNMRICRRALWNHFVEYYHRLREKFIFQREI